MARTTSPFIDLHSLMTLEDPLPPGHDDLAVQITTALASARLAAHTYATSSPVDTDAEVIWHRLLDLRAAAAELAMLLNQALILIPFQRVMTIPAATIDAVVAYLTVPQHPVGVRQIPS